MMAGRDEQRERLELLHSDTFGAGLSYSEIHRRYADSVYGQHQAAQPLRYSQQYAYDRDQMLADLGEDIHPVGHMRHTEAMITRPFLASQMSAGYRQFGPEQIVGLRLGTLMHDIGECEHLDIAAAVGTTVGDVFYEAKQASHAEQEILIRRFLYERLYPEIPPELLAQAEETIEPNDTLHSLAFNTIERIGYYQTAMKAGEVALALAGHEEERATRRFQSLARLAMRVSVNHRQVLQERSELFHHAERVLWAHRQTDERIQEELPEHVSEAVSETS